MLVGQPSLDERRQCLGSPFSHPGVWMLADLGGGGAHIRTNADTNGRSDRSDAQAAQNSVSQQFSQWAGAKQVGEINHRLCDGDWDPPVTIG